MKKLIILIALAALAIAGCAMFYGPDCNLGFITALSHPLHACDSSGD